MTAGQQRLLGSGLLVVACSLNLTVSVTITIFLFLWITVVRIVVVTTAIAIATKQRNTQIKRNVFFSLYIVIVSSNITLI